MNKTPSKAKPRVKKTTKKAEPRKKTKSPSAKARTRTAKQEPRKDSKELCCYVCDRVLFGELVYLGEFKARHKSCQPGSPEWREYYKRLPRGSRTSAGDILLKHYET